MEQILNDLNADGAALCGNAVLCNIQQMQGNLSHGYCWTFFRTCGSLFGRSLPCTSSLTTTTGAWLQAPTQRHSSSVICPSGVVCPSLMLSICCAFSMSCGTPAT